MKPRTLFIPPNSIVIYLQTFDVFAKHLLNFVLRERFITVFALMSLFFELFKFIIFQAKGEKHPEKQYTYLERSER